MVHMTSPSSEREGGREGGNEELCIKAWRSKGSTA